MGKGYSPLSMDDWAKLQRANVVSRAFPRGMAVPGLGGQEFGETPIPTPPAPASITFLTSRTSTSDAYSYSFEGIDIEEEGLIVVCLMGRNASAVSSVSINGESASIATSSFNGSNSTLNAIAYHRVTGTTTISIAYTVTGANPSQGSAITIYRINNNISDTPFDTDSGNVSSGGSNFSVDGLTGNNLLLASTSRGQTNSGINFSNLTKDIEGNVRGINFASASIKNNDIGGFTTNINYTLGNVGAGTLAVWR